MTLRRVGVGLGFCREETTATRKWLRGAEMKMVGAVGFEPTTSTV